MTAITADGDKILAGSYDMGLGELVLPPSFITTVEGEARTGAAEVNVDGSTITGYATVDVYEVADWPPATIPSTSSA